MDSAYVALLAFCILAVFAVSNGFPYEVLQSSQDLLKSSSSQSNSYIKQSYNTGNAYATPGLLIEENSDSSSDDSSDSDEHRVIKYVPTTGVDGLYTTSSSQTYIQQEAQQQQEELQQYTSSIGSTYY